jgi:hypothetical protein
MPLLALTAIRSLVSSRWIPIAISELAGYDRKTIRKYLDYRVGLFVRVPERSAASAV